MRSNPVSRLKLLFLERLRPGELQRTLTAAAVIGCVGALATIAFRESVFLLETLLFGHADSLVKAAASLVWWRRMLYPAIGGACAGAVLQWAHRCLQAETGGDYMEAIALGNKRIGIRMSLLKAVSSALSVASGSSIGREGSMVQLAALVGTLLGRLRNTPKPKLRLFVACGAAAGIAAAYNAPIAGALFVAEIVLQSIAIETLGPLLVAAVASNLTVHQFLGFGPVYHMPVFHLNLSVEAIAYALLGVVAGLLSPLFLHVLEFARRPFTVLPIPLWTKLALGGFVVGGISILNPAVWGNGYSVVDSILQGGWAWDALLAILLLKVLATAATTGSGAVGGVFTPTLFVGAVIGCLFGEVIHQTWLGTSPLSAYTAVGMGAFLAATTHAPLMAIMMIFEMTESYDLITPLMLACVLAYFVKRVLFDRSIYARSLPAAKTDAFALQTAADILRSGPPTVKVEQSLADVEQAFLRSHWQHVYITDHDGRFLGAVSLHDFGPYLRASGNANAPLPSILLKTHYPRVSSDATLGSVLEAFSGHSGERLPVLDEHEMLLGYVSKTDLMLVLRESVTAT
jgi:CIC family chloride channel protein